MATLKLKKKSNMQIILFKDKKINALLIPTLPLFMNSKIHHSVAK